MDLSAKLGEMAFDGLVIDLIPQVQLGKRTIKKLGTAATLKRGTIMAKGADGKLVVLGTGNTESVTATGDGSTVAFSLIKNDTIPAGVALVKVDGTETNDWSYNPNNGDITFKTAPANTKAIAVTTIVDAHTPDCILADDVAVGTTDDVAVIAYTAGCFNANKVIAAEDYTITDADKDALRHYDIILKAALAVNE